MTILEMLLAATLPCLVVVMVAALVRLARAESLLERVIAMDLLATFAIAVLAAYALLTNQTIFLDACLLLAVATLLGTIAFSHYVERSTK